MAIEMNGEVKQSDLVNPGWKRPDWWNYKEDWGSPAWKRRMEKVYEKARKLIQDHGFIECPECQEIHTAKTVTCRNTECGYKVDLSKFRN